MLLQPKIVNLITRRPFKNFGHKRQPIPLVTTLWHGFLTFSFTGMCLNWDNSIKVCLPLSLEKARERVSELEKISTWVFGEDINKLEADWDITENS